MGFIKFYFYIIILTIITGNLLICQSSSSSSSSSGSSSTLNKKSSLDNRKNKVTIPLPGVKEKFDSEDTINKLVAVKQLPIIEKEKQIKNLEIESLILKDYSVYLRDLDTANRNLFDFRSPFRDMVGISSDKNALEVIATRKAKKNSYKIKIDEVAEADSFISGEFKYDHPVPPSKFYFIVNNKRVEIDFKGGNFYDFYKFLKDKCSDTFTIDYLTSSKDKSIISFRTLNTGINSRVRFEGDLKVLFDLDIITTKSEDVSDIYITNSILESFSTNAIRIISNTINIPIQSEGVFTFTNNVRIYNNSYFILNISSEILTNNLNNEKIENSINGIMYNNIFSISNIDIKLDDLFIYSGITNKTETITNFNDIIELVFSNGETEVVQIDDKISAYTNNLSGYEGSLLTKVIIKNKNNAKRFIIRECSIINLSEEGGIRPKNWITKAKNSKFSLNGINIEKENNKITDLIEGVTIELKNVSQIPITVDIDYNYDLVMESILDWLDKYNKVMEYTSLLTMVDKEKIPLSERDESTLRNGVFQTESSLNTAKSRLKEAVTRAYKTIFGRELSMLDDIGISSSAKNNNDFQSDSWQNARKGILTVDKNKLKETIKLKFEGVEQLFSSDNDGDNTKDDGVAVVINNALKPLIGAGGFIDKRIALNDQKIRNEKKEVEKMYYALEDYETQLRIKFGKLNESLSSSEKMQKWLDNQFKNR